MKKKIYSYGEANWKLATLFFTFAGFSILFGFIATQPSDSPTMNGIEPDSLLMWLTRGFLGLLSLICVFLFFAVIYRIYIKYKLDLKITIDEKSITLPKGYKTIDYVTIPYDQINRLVLHKTRNIPSLLSIYVNNEQVVLPQFHVPGRALFEEITQMLLEKSSCEKIEPPDIFGLRKKS